MSNISDKAYIDPKAKIGKNVTIYPFAYIEGDVVIGDDCIIYPYVSIMNGVRMGRANKVYQNTTIVATPQSWSSATRISSVRMWWSTEPHSRTDRHVLATATSLWRVCMYPTIRRLEIIAPSVMVLRWQEIV